MVKINALVLVTIFLIVLGCGDEVDVISNPEIDNSYSELNYNSGISIDKYPSIGSVNTEFSFKLLVSNSSINIKEIKFDFNQDFNYDTVITYQDTAFTKFENIGYNTIIATAVLDNNEEMSCSTTVWNTAIEPIINDGQYCYEPDIFNGEKLTITHGKKHPTELYDLSTKQWDYSFRDSDEDIFIEMHLSVLSFDTKKLIFDNAHNVPSGKNYRFCLYDFDSSKITMDYIPIEVKNNWGKIGFSRDDKNLFYIKEEGMWDEPGSLRVYNFETGEDRLLIEESNEFCAVPTNENQVASILGNTLTIYNITTNSIDAQYDNLPSTGMFRILDDNRIFFKKDRMFYNLGNGQIDYIRFGKIENFEDLDDNDFDISYSGDKLVFNEYQVDNILYIVSLPNVF